MFVFIGLAQEKPNACDTIYLFDGGKIAAKVIEIGADGRNLVIFKNCDSLDMSIQRKNTYHIEKIRFANSTISTLQEFRVVNSDPSLPKKERARDSIKPSFFYSNIVQFVLISEPNIGYEYRVKNNLSFNLNLGFKIINILGFISNINVGEVPSVSDAYWGPRLSFCLKKYNKRKRSFYGPYARLSYLQIIYHNFYGSNSSYGGRIYGMTSQRYDADFGGIFGSTFYLRGKPYQFDFISGIRNVWASTNITGISNGATGIGGAVTLFTNPIIDGYLSYGLFQFGITKIFGGKKRE